MSILSDKLQCFFQCFVITTINYRCENSNVCFKLQSLMYRSEKIKFMIPVVASQGFLAGIEKNWFGLISSRCFWVSELIDDLTTN